jgi:hypothetical protein
VLCGRDYDPLSDETVERVFVEKLCTMPAALMDETAFACYQQFFLTINVRAGVLGRFDTPKQIEVIKLTAGKVEFKHGAEPWKVLMAVPDLMPPNSPHAMGPGGAAAAGGAAGAAAAAPAPAVSPVVNAMIALLIRLHSQLARSFNAVKGFAVRDVRLAFLRRALAYVSSAMQNRNAATESDWACVYRALLLLTRFVAGDLDREVVERNIEPRLIQINFNVKVSITTTTHAHTHADTRTGGHADGG